MKGKMTKRQKEVLKCIATHRRESAVSPTVREITDKLKISSVKSTFGTIESLIKKGYLKKTRKSRSIILTDQALEYLELKIYHTFDKWQKETTGSTTYY